MPEPPQHSPAMAALRFEIRAKTLALRLYDFAVDAVVIGLILIMLVVLVFSFVDVLLSVSKLIPALKTEALDEHEFRTLVTSVLDVFIVIELFSTFTGYVRTRHIRLAGLLDVTIVFTLREVLIKLYAQNFAIQDLVGLCLIALVLVVARSIVARFPLAPPAQ